MSNPPSANQYRAIRKMLSNNLDGESMENEIYKSILTRRKGSRSYKVISVNPLFQKGALETIDEFINVEYPSKIPPGVYKVTDEHDGLYFNYTDLSLDDLVSLKESNTGIILKEINEFYNLAEKFAKYGFSHKRGYLLVGPPGCLAGDTPLFYHRGKRNSSRPVTIEELYQKFNGIDNKEWDKTLATYLHSFKEEDSSVFYNDISAVIDSGKKPIIRIKFGEDPFEYGLTEDHKICKPDGTYIAVKDLKVGDAVLARGSMRFPSKNGKSRKHAKRVHVNTKFHSGVPKFVKSNGNSYGPYVSVPRARLIIEAEMNNLSYEEFLYFLKNDKDRSRTFKYLSSKEEVHHKDENALNDVRSNLEVFSKVDHAKEHGTVDDRISKDYTREVKITAMRSGGIVHTYDISMNPQAPNFCIGESGIVTHNSGKTSTLNMALMEFVTNNGICIISESPYELEIGLGKIRNIDKEVPVVVLLEDIDTMIKKYGEHGVLNLLDGQQTINNVIFLATTNYPEDLESRIKDRPSRFDRVIKFDYPTKEARKEFFAVKKACDNEAELDEWAEKSSGMSISHMKEIIVAVKIYGYPLDETIKRLNDMAKEIKVENDRKDGGETGFRRNRHPVW